jgi:hypothetical protein
MVPFINGKPVKNALPGGGDLRQQWALPDVRDRLLLGPARIT